METSSGGGSGTSYLIWDSLTAHEYMQENDPFDWNEAYSGDASDYAEPDSGLIEIIDGLRPGRALDIGCGAGGGSSSPSPNGSGR